MIKAKKEKLPSSGYKKAISLLLLIIRAFVHRRSRWHYPLMHFLYATYTKQVGGCLRPPAVWLLVVAMSLMTMSPVTARTMTPVTAVMGTVTALPAMCDSSCDGCRSTWEHIPHGPGKTTGYTAVLVSPVQQAACRGRMLMVIIGFNKLTL